MPTGVFRGKIYTIPLHSPGPKKGVGENSESRVIVNFVPKFVAIATEVARGEI